MTMLNNKQDDRDAARCVEMTMSDRSNEEQPSPAPLTPVERVVSGHCDHMDSPHTKDECQASWHRNWRPYTTLPSADRKSQAAPAPTEPELPQHPELPPLDDIYWQQFGDAKCGTSDVEYQSYMLKCRERQLLESLRTIAELREQVEASRKTQEYWKAEHLAGNAVLAELQAKTVAATCGEEE